MIISLVSLWANMLLFQYYGYALFGSYSCYLFSEIHVIPARMDIQGLTSQLFGGFQLEVL